MTKGKFQGACLFYLGDKSLPGSPTQWISTYISLARTGPYGLPQDTRYLGEAIVSNIYIVAPSKIEVLLVRMNPYVNGLYLAVAATGGER